MMRRCRTLLAAFTAGLMLAGLTARVSADGITTYEVTNNSNSPISVVEFTVTPSGSLASGPPVNTQIQGTTFQTDPDPSHPGDSLPLQTLVGTPNDPSIHYDLLALAFTGDSSKGYSTAPLEPGQSFHFSLNLGPGKATPVVALYNPPAGNPYQEPAGLTFQVIPPPQSSSDSHSDTPPPTTPSNTPEPLSILLWSTLAGAGLRRVRRLRRNVQG